MALGKGLEAKVSVVMVHTVNISGLVSHSLWHNYSVCCSTKSVTGNTQRKVPACVPVRLFIKADFGVPTPTLVGPCMPSHFSHVQLFATLWTAAWQAPLSIGFSQQEYRRGLPCLPSRGSSQPRGKNPCLLCLLHWQVGSFPWAPPGKPQLDPTTDKLCHVSFLLSVLVSS